MTRQSILERLGKGESLLLDGGTGSELQRRGADVLKGAEDRLRAWSATANIEYADVVRQVHSDYLRVGADVIISNNFWTTPTRLDTIGESANWRKYATAAIRNAVEARDAMRPGAYVAGGIAAPSLQGRMPPDEVVSDTREMGRFAYRKEWADHAQLLADEGVPAYNQALIILSVTRALPLSEYLRLLASRAIRSISDYDIFACGSGCIGTSRR